MRTWRSDVVAVRVRSLSNGLMQIEPYYDQRHWQMFEETENGVTIWRGYAGMFTRMALANELESHLNKLLRGNVTP